MARARAARAGARGALLPEAADIEAADDAGGTASEAEGTEADLGPAAPRSARRPISRCALFAAAGATALSGLLCLTARATGRWRPVLVEEFGGGVTSLTILQEATSCRNKDQIGLRTANASTLEECVQLCNGEKKCNGVLYHDSTGCDHLPKHTCFLYRGTCDPIGHACWERVDGTTITITTTKILATKNVVFLNEVVYSSDKPDGPGVEIAGPDGTDLSKYVVVVYSQAGEVEQTVKLSGTMKARNQQDYGIVWQGLQCQWYTAVALARGSTVVDFLSVWDAVTARAGPAKGRNSTVIVDAYGAPLQAGTSVEQMSLQLYGTGLSESAFEWKVHSASPGQVNALQNFM
ncbi:unnamed protein product [Prorocentrum cordatum]|uniref:Apple domain-containing protein n=1 Tax=Prorocentrum cordatum TaxID=2364126 RepID=A0ABN9STT6_9DINO|nr:unnamed protein product [Polarella glacialis]